MSSSFSSFNGQEIETAILSSERTIKDARLAFLVGLGFFFLCLPFCRSKKSFFDVIAARKVMKFVRTFVFLELCCLSVLFYFYITYGEPIKINASLSYGNIQYNESWVYGWPRPTTGVIFIAMGLFGDSHPYIRMICLMGCLIEVMGDCLSAYQVNEYRDQEIFLSAPAYNGFTPGILLTYYYRDIVSIALCTVTFLMTAHMTNIVGWCDPQLIHPSLITGKDHDRMSAMKRSRGERILMERMGIIESTSNGGGVGGGWNLRIKTTEDNGDNGKKDDIV